MLGNLFRNRRPERAAAQFADLLGQGDVAAALAVFEAELVGVADEAGKHLRIGYHVERWLSDRRDEDLQRVRLLAVGEPEGSAARRAWKLVSRLHAQATLALALRRGDADLFRAAVPDGLAVDADSLERVGLAALEASRLGPLGGAGDERQVVARQVLRLLPPGAATREAAPAARAHLIFWSAGVLGQRDRLLGQEALLADLPPGSKRAASVALVYSRADALLEKGQPARAAQALEGAGESATPEVVRSLVLTLGLQALEDDPRRACVWFQHQVQQLEPSAPPAWRHALMLAGGLAYFKAGKLQQGRNSIGELSKFLTAAGGGDDPAVQEALAACYYLMILSNLVATSEWASPSEGEADRAVKNRALWSPMRERLLPLVDRLSRFASELAWKGPILRALITYVEPGGTLDADELRQFSAAIDRIDAEAEGAARTRLKLVEGALITRRRGTEEAVALLRGGDVVRLRELKAAVLDGLGDALPALVRAAISMALWEDDPEYDPLADLTRIPTQPAEEPAIRRCIELVEAARAAHQVAEECVARKPSDRAQPAQAALAALGPELARSAGLATALAHLRRDDVAAARQVLPEPGDGVRPQAVSLVRFHLAWREGDVETCRRLGAGEARGLLERSPRAAAGLQGRAILRALERGQPAAALALLPAGGDPASPELPAQVVRLNVWLIERDQPQLAQQFLQHLRGRTRDERGPLGVVCQALSILVAARRAQYSACIEQGRALLSAAAPARSAFGDAQANQHVYAWVGLFVVLAELALTARADDLKVRWPAARRSLEIQADGLRRQTALRPYVDLLTGLLTFLEADTPADDATLDKLSRGQRSLPLRRGGPFVEQAIGKLNWRKRIMEDFWSGLREGDLKRGRTIYQTELLPAYGARMPAAVQLGAVLLDWDAGAPLDGLLVRLTRLEREAPELNAALLERVRAYIREGEQYRRLIGLLREKSYGPLAELAERAAWNDCQPGSMPVPVAITLMYAYHETRRVKESLDMGKAIGESPDLVEWVRDYAYLLLGYVLFGQEKYPEAAAAFEKTSRNEILRHDTDRYRAAAKFSHGLQLLAVDQQEKAFLAFAHSLGRRGSSAKNADLAPLFIHFGLKSIQTHNGRLVREAFELMGKSLDGLPPQPSVTLNKLLADMGHLLCQALMDEDVTGIGGERFLALLPRAEGVGDPFDAKTRQALENSLRRQAICQELRRERRMEPRGRQKPAQLYASLTRQIEALANLHAEAEPHDPVLLALDGAAALLLGPRAKLPQALEAIEKALRLGVGSHALATLHEKHRKQFEAARKERGVTLDLFDVYLTTGIVPLDERDQLVRGDDLAALYRMHRAYSPDDLLADETPSQVRTLTDRLEHLLGFVGSAGFRDDGELQSLIGSAKRLLPKLTEAEAGLLDIEKKILDVLARRLRAESLESA